MAHKKAGGSSRNGRDSNPKYLGVKVYGGQALKRATSSFASAAPSFIRVPVLAWAAITPCLP
jgi:hypothetical protein